jgi:hypothetical protein
MLSNVAALPKNRAILADFTGHRSNVRQKATKETEEVGEVTQGATAGCHAARNERAHK